MWLVWGMTMHFRNVLKCSQVGEMSCQLWRQKQWARRSESRGPGGSQGANQGFQCFNPFVRCLIGCLARLGFLWPQLETSVKRLDGHSESVNCFQQSAINCPSVSQVKTRSMSDYLSCSRSFHRELYFQAACLHACFCLYWGHCSPPPPSACFWISILLFLLEIGLNPVPFFIVTTSQHSSQPGQGPGMFWTVVTRICISSASVWPSTGLQKRVFLGLFFVLRINFWISIDFVDVFLIWIYHIKGWYPFYIIIVTNKIIWC